MKKILEDLDCIILNIEMGQELGLITFDNVLRRLNELRKKIKESVPAETRVMPEIAEDKIKTLDDLLFEWKYGKRKPYQPPYIVDILVAIDAIEMLFAEELKKVR